MIDANFFLQVVIRPVLLATGTHSADAERLLLAIVAHESDMGRYSIQQGISESRAAQGFFMVEKPTEADIWETYLSRKPTFHGHAIEFLKLCPNATEPLRQNPFYACFMARMKLWREPTSIPKDATIEQLAEYWFDFYNGSPESERAQKVAEFINDYKTFVG